MRLVRNLSSAQPPAPSAVTIGVFDGAHLGHQKIITGMVAAARAADRVAVAYTFDPHPAAAMGHAPPPLLTTLEERAEIVASLGVDILVAPPFTADTANTKASEFVDLLIKHVRLAQLWAGPDFALGYQREGDIPFLTRLGQERGFNVRVVEPVRCLGNWVSSSRIRAALVRGDLNWANECLGRPYRLGGHRSPRHGQHQPGHVSIIDVAVAAQRLIPAPGAYACRGHFGELRNQPCIAYVRNPDDVTGGDSTVEVHLLCAADESLAEEIALDFVAMLRSEAPAGTPIPERSLLLEDARRAQALLDGPS
jgi:riboflavin kinase/FMN adenylyltransferase